MVFESEKLSVIVADPQHTKVNIQPESTEEIPRDDKIDTMDRENDFSKSSAVDAIMSQVKSSTTSPITNSPTKIC